MTLIRKANNNEIDSVYSIVSQCAATLSEQGFHHWTNYYTFDKMKTHFEEHEVYVLEENNEIVGTISISQSPPEYYEDDYSKFFSTDINNNDALYVSKLAILPTERGKGLGKKLIHFCEETAEERGLRYIRFDARSDIHSLVSFYNKLDYKVVGTIKEDDENYNIYEKIIMQ